MAQCIVEVPEKKGPERAFQPETSQKAQFRMKMRQKWPIGRKTEWRGGGRVDEGDCSPPPPTEPDVRDSRIRLFISWSHCKTINRLAPFDPERSWPPPLPFEVSLRRSQNSMFLPSFPSKTPCYGTAFPPQGPLGQVPLTHRYY